MVLLFGSNVIAATRLSHMKNYFPFTMIAYMEPFLIIVWRRKNWNRSYYIHNGMTRCWMFDYVYAVRMSFVDVHTSHMIFLLLSDDTEFVVHSNSKFSLLFQGLAFVQWHDK